MANTTKMNFPIPAENQDPWYDAFVALLGAIDASTYSFREDRQAILMGGGVMTFTASSGLLTWANDISESAPITGFLWVIPAGSIAVADGQVLYVNLSRSPSNNVNVVLTVASQVPSSDQAFIIAIRRGSRVYFRNGASIADGEVYRAIDAPYEGDQGNQGWQGFQGAGNFGVQGFQGNQGWQGFQGLIGFQGNQGWQGFQGFQGRQGWQGNQGWQGWQGNQGWQGFQGNQGWQGFQGNQGWQGFQGNQGWQGFQGNQGFQGLVGTQGFQGFQDFTGQAAAGAVGVVLSSGPTGSHVGVQGWLTVTVNSITRYMPFW